MNVSTTRIYMHTFFCLNKVKKILLPTLPIVFCSSGICETIEYVCSYKKTILSNPYDNKVHVEKNPKLANYKQNIIVNVKTERVTRVYSYDRWDGEKNIREKKEITSPVSKASRDLGVPNKLIYWHEQTLGKKGIYDGQVSVFALATWTRTTLTRSYISVITAYDTHYDCKIKDAK